jgi:hypothetical protein
MPRLALPRLAQPCPGSPLAIAYPQFFDRVKGLGYLSRMPRVLKFPERAQANVPLGTLAALEARFQPGDDHAKLLRRIVSNWIRDTPANSRDRPRRGSPGSSSR